MNPQPNITAVLLTFNQCAFVAAALRSLLTQSRPAEQLIVADDASTDGTLQIVEQILDEAGTQALVLRDTRNLGISRNWNRALRLATGEYIAVFEGDDVSTANRLEVASSRIGACSNVVGSFASSCRLIDEGGVELGRIVVEDAVRNHESRHEATAEAPGATLVFHRSVISEFGLFDRRLRTCDVAVMRRSFVLRNAACVFAMATLVDYRQHSRNESKFFSLDLDSFPRTLEALARLATHERGLLAEARKVVRYVRSHYPSSHATNRYATRVIEDQRGKVSLAIAAQHGRNALLVAGLRNLIRGRARTLSLRVVVLRIAPLAVPAWRWIRRRLGRRA